MRILNSIIIVVFVTIASLAAQGSLYFSAHELAQIKKVLNTPGSPLESYRMVLKELADLRYDHGPWSVTFYESKAVSGNPHDYYSESPYWWPNPDDPDGPYIRKDGIHNPNRFMDHKNALNDLYDAFLTLSLAGYFLDNPEYSERAAQLIKVWFLDEATRMNPHLEYAQAITNRSEGRSFGIIDTHRFVRFLEAVYIIRLSGALDDEAYAGMQDWFRDYLHWLSTSEKGLKERNYTNNHASWWAAQAMAYAHFCGDEKTIHKTYRHIADTLLPSQMTKAGRFPEEEKRTRSLSYCTFNLNAHSFSAAIARDYGYDYWEHALGDGKTLKTAISFYTPFVLNPATWDKEDVVPFSSKEVSYLVFAGMRYPDKDYFSDYRRLISLEKPIEKDPFIILLNMYVLSRETL